MDIGLKLERISIKWRIFAYIISFCAILLALLWLVQTVYLDSFYRSIKKSELNNARKKIVSSIGSDNISNVIEEVSQRYDICVLIADENGNTLYSYESGRNCNIHKLSESVIKQIYSKSGEKDSYVDIKLEDKLMQDMPDKFSRAPIKKNDNVMQSCIVKNNEGKKLVVILDSVISPVDATKQTLRVQLIYISGFMVILSLILAFMISWKISKSIIKVNRAAKELSKGNYNVEFDGKDYKEISELSDTLNYTASQLEKTDLLQKELIANVSHDLRTPLTMITGYSEVMRDIPGENTPENVQVIIDETNRLTRLVNDMLDISKIQAGFTGLETKEYDVTESIASAIERYDRLVGPYGYNIIFNSNEHIIVDADEFKIYQVIYNLISNAVNYTGEDKKVIVNQKFDGKKVRIEVIDTGEGISESELENVWERYYKVDKNHKRAVLGTGLGLSIVKNILKLHNANFGVESEKGQGSTFWFELQGTIIERSD